MPRKHLTLKQKLRIIEYYKEGYTSSELHEIFCVTQNTIYNIVRNHKSYLDQVKSGTSLTKKNRKLSGKQIDDKVYVWLKQRKYRNAPINDTIIRTKAKQFARSLGSSTFNATDDWLNKFKNKHPGEFDYDEERGNSVDKLIESVREQLIELDSAEKDDKNGKNDEIIEAPVESNEENYDNVFTPKSPDPSINEEETEFSEPLFVEEAPVENNGHNEEETEFAEEAPVENNQYNEDISFEPMSPPPNEDNSFEPMSPAPSNNEEMNSGRLPVIIIEEPSTPTSIDIEDRTELTDSIYGQISPSSPLESSNYSADEMAIDSVHEQSTSPGLEDNVGDIFNDFIQEQPPSAGDLFTDFIEEQFTSSDLEENSADMSYIIVDKTPNSEEDNVVDMLIDPVDEQSNASATRSTPLIIISSPNGQSSTSDGSNVQPRVTFDDASKALGVINMFLEQNPQYCIRSCKNFPCLSLLSRVCFK